MITGSHNPPNYNGLKFSLNNEAFFGEKIKNLYNSILNDNLSDIYEEGEYKEINIKKNYFEWMKKHFSDLNKKLNQQNKIKIVVDAANGTASTYAPELLENFNVEVIPLFCEEDGYFPNHPPDPTIEDNINILQKTVVKEQANFGVAFDGDSDRIIFTDENGKMIYGDEILYIFAKDLNEKLNHPPLVVLDVKSSQTIINSLKKENIKIDVYKSGHSLIKSRLKEINADLAGETSAHIFFADKFFGYDDAIYAMMRMLEIYSSKKLHSDFKFSNLLSDLPERFITPEIRIKCSDDKKFDIINDLSNKLNSNKEKLQIIDILEIDGIRILFPDGWALVRASNTEPAITTRFESVSKDKLEFYKNYIIKKLNNLF